MAQHEDRAARWKILVRTDPRRAVRALKIRGFTGESVEGDTLWDGPHIIGHLKTESAQPQSAVWRRLVEAGIFDAMSVCATQKLYLLIGFPSSRCPLDAQMFLCPPFDKYCRGCGRGKSAFPGRDGRPSERGTPLNRYRPSFPLTSLPLSIDYVFWMV